MDEPRRRRAGTRRPDEDRSGGFEHGGWHLHVLGGGKRIFPDDGALGSLRLVDSEVVSTGAMLLTYTRLSDAEQR